MEKISIILLANILFFFGCANVKEIDHDTFKEVNKIDPTAKIDNYLNPRQSIIVRFLCYKDGKIKINNIWLNNSPVSVATIYKHRIINGENKDTERPFIDYLEISRGGHYSCYKPEIGMKNQKALSVFYTFNVTNPLESVVTTAFVIPLTILSMNTKNLPQYTTHKINSDTEKMIGNILVTELSKELAHVFGRMPSDRLFNLINKYQTTADFNLMHDKRDVDKVKNYVFVDYKNINGSYEGNTRLFDGVRVAHGYGKAKGNQIRYEGEFFNGKMQGMGTIIVKLGSDEEVYWKSSGQGSVKNEEFYLTGYFKNNRLIYECNTIEEYKQSLNKNKEDSAELLREFDGKKGIIDEEKNSEEDDDELRRALEKRLEDIEA